MRRQYLAKGKGEEGKICNGGVKTLGEEGGFVSRGNGHGLGRGRGLKKRGWLRLKFRNIRQLEVS